MSFRISARVPYRDVASGWNRFGPGRGRRREHDRRSGGTLQLGTRAVSDTPADRAHPPSAPLGDAADGWALARGGRRHPRRALGAAGRALGSESQQYGDFSRLSDDSPPGTYGHTPTQRPRIVVGGGGPKRSGA